jgi:hypothetical protein
MKESWSETLWNEEIRRRGLVDIAEKVREARWRWYVHVIRRDEGEPFGLDYGCKLIFFSCRKRKIFVRISPDSREELLR